MRVAEKCICCSSINLAKKIGYFEPFISHRIFNLEYQRHIVKGVDIGFPRAITNSIFCKDCEMIFSQIRFDKCELEKIYDTYRDENYNEVRIAYEPNYKNIAHLVGNSETERLSRQEAMAQFFSNEIDFHEIRSILDYGGDSGQHIPVCFGNAIKFVYDISKKKAVDGVVNVSSLDHLSVVDLVVNANVLEHMPYPSQFFDEVKHLCNNDTYIFIDVPFELTADNPYPVAFHEHINFFSPSSIEALLRSHQFALLKMEKVSVDYGFGVGVCIYALAKYVEK